MGWIIALFVVLIIAVWFISAYNKLIDLKNKVKNAWSQIEVHLKRRFDLSPNLVNTVKGYAAHESDTLQSVIEARNRYNAASTPAEQMEASNQLSATLGHLFALTEAYPDLKANQSFMSLQNELTETENKVAFTRQFYNDTVMKYNTAIQKFPTVIAASLFRFGEEPYFKAGEEAQNAPKVEF